MRKRIFEIIERAEGRDTVSQAYDVLMIAVIVVSLIPLAFKREPLAFVIMDKAALVIFIADYVMRWVTADYRYNDHSLRSFLRYPFSLTAIIDLLSILPSLSIISRGFKVLRVLRMIRAFRVLRVLKGLRYSKSVRIILNVIKSSQRSLAAVLMLALGYIVVAALIIFNVEPDSFDNYFDAVYWATVSLTTVGYGDIYPVSVLGRIITMLSSLTGVAVVALPAGIITAGYMNELRKEQSQEEPRGDDL